MLAICLLVIRRFIVVKNRSQGVIIDLPVGKINDLFVYIYTYMYTYIYIYVKMGSYDGAEFCELSCIFMLSLIGNIHNLNNIGLYRDNGLAIFKNTSGRNNWNRFLNKFPAWRPATLLKQKLQHKCFL